MTVNNEEGKQRVLHLWFMLWVLWLIVLFEFRKPHPFLTETREGICAMRTIAAFF